nr:hypothetical protein [uncultured bacterium]
MKSSKKAECYADIFAKKEVRYTSFFYCSNIEIFTKKVLSLRLKSTILT